jgi:hypothetical protein
LFEVSSLLVFYTAAIIISLISKPKQAHFSNLTLCPYLSFCTYLVASNYDTTFSISSITIVHLTPYTMLIQQYIRFSLIPLIPPTVSPSTNFATLNSSKHYSMEVSFLFSCSNTCWIEGQEAVCGVWVVVRRCFRYLVVMSFKRCGLSLIDWQRERGVVC